VYASTSEPPSERRLPAKTATRGVRALPRQSDRRRRCPAHMPMRPANSSRAHAGRPRLQALPPRLPKHARFAIGEKSCHALSCRKSGLPNCCFPDGRRDGGAAHGAHFAVHIAVLQNGAVLSPSPAECFESQAQCRGPPTRRESRPRKAILCRRQTVAGSIPACLQHFACSICESWVKTWVLCSRCSRSALPAAICSSFRKRSSTLNISVALNSDPGPIAPRLPARSRALWNLGRSPAASGRKQRRRRAKRLPRSRELARGFSEVHLKVVRLRRRHSSVREIGVSSMICCKLRPAKRKPITRCSRARARSDAAARFQVCSYPFPVHSLRHRRHGRHR